jgi:hypothetical protein
VDGSRYEPAVIQEVSMKIKVRPTWLLAVAAGVAVAVVAMVQRAPTGAAGTSGRAYTVKTVREQGSVWITGGGKTMRPGRLSAGNRLLETNAVRRDDGVEGLFVATVMVASPRTVSAQRAIGLMRAVYRFADGDIYVEGFVSFAGPSGSGVIVGGTGSYRGARGTFKTTEVEDVLRLLP